METKIKTKIKLLIKSTFVLVIFTLAIQVGAVWVIPPAGNPPANNIPPPVNTGNDPQSKTYGAFAAGGLRSFGIGLFDSQVGIGTDGSGIPHTPTQPLDVIGNIKFTGALMPASVSFPAGNPGAVNDVLKSNGPNAAPSWGTVTGSGMTNPMTTIGDIIYATATGTPVGTPAPAGRLNIGSLGQVLTVSASGIPSWVTASGGGWLWSRTASAPFYTFLTNSGDKVGIGTSTPTQQLQITENFEMPKSTSTIGIIYKGGYRFLHDYGTFDPTGASGTKKQSIFIGANAGNLGSNSSCLSNNIGIGIEALASITSSSGSCTLPAASGNVGIGNIALTNLTTGTNNTAVGPSSVGSVTTGQNNVGVGTAALSSSQTTSSSNVGVGYWAGVGAGDYGTYVGSYACNVNAGGSGNNCNLTTGNTNNTAIGYQAKIAGNSITNATALGNGATVSASNKVRIGNGSVTVIEGQVGWSFPSDMRLKKDIQSTDLGLDFINNLNPVSYRLKTEDEKSPLSYGFIAQDVQKALEGKNTNIVMTDNSPEGMLTMRPNDLISPMVKAIQEQQKEIEDLKAEIEILKSK